MGGVRDRRNKQSLKRTKISNKRNSLFPDFSRFPYR